MIYVFVIGIVTVGLLVGIYFLVSVRKNVSISIDLYQRDFYRQIVSMGITYADR